MLTAQLIGNLGHGAESKQISERHALTFSVAHKEGRDANTTWVKVVYFCREDTRLREFLTHGAKVYVAGTVRVKTYQMQNGQVVPDITIFADRIELLGNSGQPQAPSQGAQPAYQQRPSYQQGGYAPQPGNGQGYQQPATAPGNDSIDGDLPF